MIANLASFLTFVFLQCSAVHFEVLVAIFSFYHFAEVTEKWESCLWWFSFTLALHPLACAWFSTCTKNFARAKNEWRNLYSGFGKQCRKCYIQRGKAEETLLLHKNVTCSASCLA